MENQAESEGSVTPAAAFHGRYRLGLALVAGLVLLNEIVVQPPLLRLSTDAPLINVAGRQRMLSQRLAKAALALQGASEASECERRRDELNSVFNLWETSHETIRSDERNKSSREPDTSEILGAFREIEPSHLRIRSAVAAILAGPDRFRDQSEVPSLLQAESEFLPAMERIVDLFERRARRHVERLLWTGWGVTALILAGLAAIGRLVHQPAMALITRQVRELRDARDELEQRVIDRTRALENESAARSTAEERQRAMIEQFSHVTRTTTVGEMASGLAHELSQPLGAITNYAEGCQVALDGPTPNLEEIRAILAKITATSLRAGSIVKRIRRFVTRHASVREPFEPNTIVAEVEEFFREVARRLGVAVELDLASDLPLLNGDSVQVQQVLVNLVGNAFDALRAAQTVHPRIVVRTSRTSSGDVEFAVHDTGEGIPETQIPRVFDAYFSTRDEGMGMGLAISRTIIEAHQGRISVESRPGGPTSFRFTLPVASADDAGTDGLHRG